MAIETQTISAENVIETVTRVFAHPDDLQKLELLNVSQPTDIDYMLNKLNSIQNPIQDRGDFDPTLDGLFPEGAMSGWLYRIVEDGSIGSMNMNIGDTIFAISDVVDRTDSTLWVKIDNTEEGGLSVSDLVLNFDAVSDTTVASSSAVKLYVDNEILSLSSTLMAEIEIASQTGGTYITTASPWLDIELDPETPTNSKIVVYDNVQSIIRIYIEGWGDIVSGWTHSQQTDVIYFDDNIEHVGKRCIVTYLVKMV